MSSRGDIKWKFFPVNGEVAKKSRYSTTFVRKKQLIMDKTAELPL